MKSNGMRKKLESLIEAPGAGTNRPPGQTKGRAGDADAGIMPHDEGRRSGGGILMNRKKIKPDDGLKMKRVRPGRWIGPPPSKADLVRLYVRDGMSVRDVAAALGCSKDAVHRALKGYKIKARTPAKRSRLMKLDQERLFADLAEMGIDRTVKKWGIPRRTFLDYLARIRRKRP